MDLVGTFQAQRWGLGSDANAHYQFFVFHDRILALRTGGMLNDILGRRSGGPVGLKDFAASGATTPEELRRIGQELRKPKALQMGSPEGAFLEVPIESIVGAELRKGLISKRVFKISLRSGEKYTFTAKQANASAMDAPLQKALGQALTVKL